MTSTAVQITREFRKPSDEMIFSSNLAPTSLYDWHLEHNPNYPLFVFHDGRELRYITYSSVHKAITRGARYILSALSQHDKQSGTPRRPVVAIIANTDTITYFCTILGIFKAAGVVFIVSPRNTPAAVAELLQRTGTTHALVSSDAPMQELAASALTILTQSGHQVEQHPMPLFEDLYSEAEDPTSPFAADVDIPAKYNMSAPGFALHSSGSTGHPKPVTWTLRGFIARHQNLMRTFTDLQGVTIGCHATAMFHGMATFTYLNAPMAGFIVATFKPASPPLAPTPEAVWEGFLLTGVNIAYSVPAFLEQWARDPEKVTIMKSMRGVVTGGAALNEEVGNTLAAQGVSLYTLYGATETGLLNNFFPPSPGMDWAYWSLADDIKCVFRPQGDGTYEVVVLSQPGMELPKPNAKEAGVDAYVTSDLVVPHPTKSGLWKIVGRLDEQIVLSNGEKTNPLPLEKMISADHHVHSVIMFGRGRFQNGVLIQPTKEYEFDPADETRLAEFRNMIWSTMERVNAFAPQHSRVFKEMILVTHPDKPFQVNVKGLPRRSFILEEYAQEIEAVYKAVENITQTDVPIPETWDANRTLVFVRAVVRSTLQRSVADDADIFRNGGDSLQATWIRNIILGAIRRASPAAGRRIPMNLVFAFPTIASLANIVFDTIHGTDSSAERTPDELWTYVERYSADVPSRPTRHELEERPKGGKDVVIITGTTGGFGCDALEHLLRDAGVERVYAFNRAQSNAAKRQRSQFRVRGLDENLLDGPKFVMVEAVLHERGFGIDARLLDEIRRSVTHIMLNAWKVNFSMSIASFEVDMQGTRNFIDLAISSPYTTPPSVLFVSSIGTLANYKGIAPVPETSLDDPAAPFGNGYAESKWIMEHVLERIFRKTDVHTVVMRLGQVAGDSHGYWNEKEWFPALVKSAQFQHCLPDIEGTVSWFPSYEAAKAFTELRHSPNPFVHLAHPRPVPWHGLIAPIASTLGVPLVEYDVWLAALKGSVKEGAADELKAMAANPALHLLPFFEGGRREATTDDMEPMGLVKLATNKATRVSNALATLPQLDAARAKSWVAAWRRSGFLV